MKIFQSSLLLLVFSFHSWAADNHQEPLLEEKVEAWSRKHLGLGRHFEKVIFDPATLKPSDFTDAVVTVRDLNQKKKKISFNEISNYFQNDKFGVQISYVGEKKVINLPEESLSIPTHHKNLADTSIKIKIQPGEIFDTYSWVLESPFTKMDFKTPLFLSILTHDGGGMSVDTKQVNSTTFNGTIKKHNEFKLDWINVPPQQSAFANEVLTKQHMEQPFNIKFIYDTHFAVISKNYKKKTKIDIYQLSAAFLHSHKHSKYSIEKGVLVVKERGMFKGDYITSYGYKTFIQNPETKEKTCIAHVSFEFLNYSSQTITTLESTQKEE